MSKRKRREKVPQPLQERIVVFTFNAKEHMDALNELLATLKQHIYSTEACLVLSEDEKLAKIIVQGNAAQISNFDGFLRDAGIKTVSHDPNAEIAGLIAYCH